MATVNVVLTDNETCTDYFNVSLGEDPYEFHATSTIERLHRNAIRFGKTNDISVLYRNNATHAEKREYVGGVATSSIMIFVFITTWFALILLCMCLGPDRVGFFSGRQRKLERERRDSEEEIDGVVANEGNDASLKDPNADVEKNGDVSNDKEDDIAMVDQNTGVEEDSPENVVNEHALPDEFAEKSHRKSLNKSHQDVGTGITGGEGDSPENVVIEEALPVAIVENSHRESLIESQNDDVKSSFRKSLNESQDDELEILNQTRLFRARIVVLTCSVGVVISVILFLSYGVQNLLQSSKDVVAGVEEGQELATEAIELINNAISRQESVVEVLTPYLEDINGICPIVSKAICEDITNSLTCDFEGIPVPDEFQAAFLWLLSYAKNTTLSKLDGVRQDLISLNEELEKVADKISSFNWAYAIASVFAILLLVANIIISHGIIVAWRRETSPPKYKCFTKMLGMARHWLMVPVFVFLVVMSWMFSMIFIIGSIAAADLCYGSPDKTVLALLEQGIVPVDGIVQRLSIYYVKGCPTDLVPDELSRTVNEILTSADMAASMASNFFDEEVYETFTATCGSDTSFINATSIAVGGTICNLGITLAETALYFSCANWSK